MQAALSTSQLPWKRTVNKNGYTKISCKDIHTQYSVGVGTDATILRNISARIQSHTHTHLVRRTHKAQYLRIWRFEDLCRTRNQLHTFIKCYCLALLNGSVVVVVVMAMVHSRRQQKR